MSAEQGTAAWLYERVGCVTASRFRDVMDRTKKGEPGAKRTAYLWELVVERITGQPADHFTSAAMQWGREQEIASRMHYEARTGAVVEEVGFLRHPELKLVGGSPDGLVGDDGGWESKSPFNSAVHLQTVLNGMPEDHVAQVQGLMWITGRKWWDFQSFDPRLPQELKIYVQRVERDDAYIATLESEVRIFEAEVHALHERLTTQQNTQREPAKEHGGDNTDSGGQGSPTPGSFGGLENREEVIAKPSSNSAVPDKTRERVLREWCEKSSMDYAGLLSKAEVRHADELTDADYQSALDMLRRRFNKLQAGAKVQP